LPAECITARTPQLYQRHLFWRP